MAYSKPQVQVFQEFTLAPSELTDPLRAHISGPNAMLHRFADAAEKPLINVGPYDRLSGGAYPWPDRQAGSLVDGSRVKLFLENALLRYFEDLIGDASGGRGVVTPVSGRKNWLRHSTVAFRANGSQYPRSALLLDRDVRVGDIVYVRGVSDNEDACDELELWTQVQGFASDEVSSVISDVTNDDGNAATTVSDIDIDQVAGPVNCITLAEGGDSDYEGLSSGFVQETYTITVIKSSVAGCNAARLRIVSASGTDNQDEVDPGEIGSEFPIGTRGLLGVFQTGSGACESTAEGAGIPANELVVGQVFEIVISQDFEEVCGESGGTYTGPDNDTYIIEVTKGGLWSDLPEITVTTAKGLDSSGPTSVTDANTPVPAGTHGLTISFVDCGSLEPGSLSLGDDDLAGLRKGDKFYITVTSGQNGPVRTLILRDDLPPGMRDAEDLDLRLFIANTIEVTEQRLSDPPLVNYEVEDTQLIVQAGITAYDASWTSNGVQQPLLVWDGRVQSQTGGPAYGTQYIEYREWLATLAGSVQFINDVADLDDIPGPLDEDNPLKWGVYRALQNSGGTNVGYTAVANPNSLGSWQDVLERVNGREDLYNLVPLTTSREVWNLYQAQVNSDSLPENGSWKAMFVNLQAVAESLLVGQSDADTQSLRPTSTDGNVVLATLEDNPDASGQQYTLLSVPANNGGFLEFGVRAGDVARFLFTINAFGEPSYREFIVDRVLSQNSLLLLTGNTAPVTVPQKLEIWRVRTRTEIAENLVQQAQSFADPRVVAVWPDLVGTAGNTQSGMYLAAALAGLVSGVVPHQPLSNVEIAGFDDLTARTTDFFSETQLNRLAEGGVWIATETRDGTPITRHALTTSTLDLNRSEEMIRRNLDSISYFFLKRLRPFIGRTNATESMLRRLRFEVTATIDYLLTNAYTAELGPQLIAGEIAKGPDGVEILRIHPLAADQVEIVLDLTLPAPLNRISLHLVI